MEARPVADVKPSGETASCNGLLEHGQERGGILRVGKGGEGDDPGGVAEGELMPVGGSGVAGAFVKQAFVREPPVHGRRCEGMVDAAFAVGADEGFDRERGPLGLGRNE